MSKIVSLKDLRKLTGPPPKPAASFTPFIPTQAHSNINNNNNNNNNSNNNQIASSTRTISGGILSRPAPKPECDSDEEKNNKKKSKSRAKKSNTNANISSNNDSPSNLGSIHRSQVHGQNIVGLDSALTSGILSASDSSKRRGGAANINKAIKNITKRTAEDDKIDEWARSTRQKGLQMQPRHRQFAYETKCSTRSSIVCTSDSTHKIGIAALESWRKKYQSNGKVGPVIPQVDDDDNNENNNLNAIIDEDEDLQVAITASIESSQSSQNLNINKRPRDSLENDLKLIEEMEAKAKAPPKSGKESKFDSNFSSQSVDIVDDDIQIVDNNNNSNNNSNSNNNNNNNDSNNYFDNNRSSSNISSQRSALEMKYDSANNRENKSTIPDGSDDDYDNNDDLFVMEAILDKKHDNRGKVKYYIKWKGYSEEESTWEPEENIIDKLMLQEFEREYKKKYGLHHTHISNQNSNSNSNSNDNSSDNINTKEFLCPICKGPTKAELTVKQLFVDANEYIEKVPFLSKSELAAEAEAYRNKFGVDAFKKTLLVANSPVLFWNFYKHYFSIAGALSQLYEGTAIAEKFHDYSYYEESANIVR